MKLNRHTVVSITVLCFVFNALDNSLTREYYMNA